MSQDLVGKLFDNDIDRRIEEVIKVDQTDEEIIRHEISEYVVTDPIRHHFTEFLELYRQTPNQPHEGVGMWISGFFGSGKSSFAKILGIAIENREVMGADAGELLGRQAGDKRMQVLLATIAEQIPTHTVIFDVSTERGIRSGNQRIQEVMYRMFLESLGYARDLDLAELEITLEGEGRLAEFVNTFRDLYDKEWDEEKGKIAFAIQQASRVMHELEPETYPAVDSWRGAAQDRADVSAGLLAERCDTLMQRRRPGHSLMFVVDEIGQFVARDVQRMLDLQGVVQQLGVAGRGDMWLVVTSQEKLTEIVGGLDSRRVELARLMDRFPTQVHLEPSDISEVTSKRVLSKTAEAERVLRDLFTEHRGRLTDNTRLTADIALPELTAESFIDLYPLLPYQIDLVIQVVSGLRTQGGISSHVGGANRTIIKLAQQLLIHPDVNLAEEPIGTLARLDQVYDLVSGNISSEVRGKIDSIETDVDHPLAQAVAKAVCLLQYVQSVHRTPENIAAVLHPAVDADSRLPQVREALAALVKAHKVREGDDGYRIPTPAEDDWERQRSSLAPKPGDVHRIHAEIVEELWQPQPTHKFLKTKQFKAGLYFRDKSVVEGDIPFYVTLDEDGDDHSERVAEMRSRSQEEAKSVFWAVPVNGEIDRLTAEVYRSQEMLSRKERGAQTRDEAALVAEEKRRLNQRDRPRLKSLVNQACLSGMIFFRGNDRSPDDSIRDVSQAASETMAQCLPDVFERYVEAAATVGKNDLDALLTTENLRGLTPVFTELDLVKEEGGKPVFVTDRGPLAEVYSRIENRSEYGENPTGRYLTDEFSREPFGWDFDVVRLFVVALLRSGKIEATSKGQVIASAMSLDARNTFPNNNLFRQASFRPKKGIDFKELVDAVKAFQEVFGREIEEIEQRAVASSIKDAVSAHEQQVRDVLSTLHNRGLPGAQVLRDAEEQMRAIRSGREDQAILSFNSSYNELKEAIKRASDISTALDEAQLQMLARAQTAIDKLWAFLRNEPDIDEECRQHAEALKDLLQRETFYRELPAIKQHTEAIESEYEQRYEAALQERAAAYTDALETLHGTPGWEQLDEDRQAQVAEPLISCTARHIEARPPIPQLRSDTEACPTRLNKAIEHMATIIDGERVVKLNAGSFFRGGIETEEQLDAALEGLREECERLIGTGKKVLLQ